MADTMVCRVCGSTEWKQLEHNQLRCCSCRTVSSVPARCGEMLERANHFLRETKDFDEAAAAFKKIVEKAPDEPAAYWGLVCCRFGIDYVKEGDKYKPTCRRTVRGSILEDGDYLMALEKAGEQTRESYIREARYIDAVQNEIKTIAAREKPYDVFISFKWHQDNSGIETEDAFIADEIYTYLTKQKSLNVFYAPRSMKPGMQYEPYIYAALVSAPVMVLIGTKREYMEAEWVKNEWARYISMADEARLEGKFKNLLPVLKGMRPEQMPGKLSGYQATMWAEPGAQQKLYRQVDELVELAKPKAAPLQSPAYTSGSSLSQEANNLCDMGYDYLQVGNFPAAKDCFENALKKDRTISRAHWGSILATQSAHSDDALASRSVNLTTDFHYRQAMSFANPKEAARYKEVASLCEDNLRRADEQTKCNAQYRSAVNDLTNRYSARFGGDKRVSVNANADRMIDNYHAAKEKHESAKLTLSNIKEDKPVSIKNHILTITSGVFFLIAGILLSFLVSQVNALEESAPIPDYAEPVALAAAFLVFLAGCLLCFRIVNRYLGWFFGAIGGVVGGAVLASIFLNNYNENPINYPLYFGVILIVCGIICIFLIKKKASNAQNYKLSVQKAVAGSKVKMDQAYQALHDCIEQDVHMLNSEYREKFGNKLSYYQTEDELASRVLKSVSSYL